jgi:hypothetical protein
MSTFAIEPQQSRRPTREEGMALAAERNAARKRRTARIRRTVAVIAAVAFIGPFGVIYMNVADGKDPALAAAQVVTTTASRSVSQGIASGTSSAKRQGTSSGSISSGSSSTSVAPVTTQQS